MFGNDNVQCVVQHGGLAYKKWLVSLVKFLNAYHACNMLKPTC